MKEWKKSLNNVELWAENWNSKWTISQQTSNDLLQIHIQEFETFKDAMDAWYDMYFPGIYHTMKDSADQLFDVQKNWKFGIMIKKLNGDHKFKLVIPCEYKAIHSPQAHGILGLEEYEPGKIMFKCKSGKKIIKLSYNRITGETFQMTD